jgi:hypothetical protein
VAASDQFLVIIRTNKQTPLLGRQLLCPKISYSLAVPEKRLRFRTTVDASETQVIEAMQKIASHIGNTSKFSKASKLALQLIEAGSVKPGTIGHFFAILEAAMSSPGACNDPSVRADYHKLFDSAQGVTEVKFLMYLKQIVAQLCQVTMWFTTFTNNLRLMCSYSTHSRKINSTYGCCMQWWLMIFLLMTVLW